MKSLILAFGLSMSLAFPQDLEGQLSQMKRLRDDVPAEVLVEVAEVGTKEALDALMGFYPSLATIYTRIQVLSAISTFDGLSGHAGIAAEFIANAAGRTDDPEVRDAGLAALRECAVSGPHYLRILVESTMPAAGRERALTLYLEMDQGVDLEFLKGIYVLPEMAKATQKERKSKKRSKGKKSRDRKKREQESEEEQPIKEVKRALSKSTTLRELALKAYGPSADVRDLQRYLEKEPSPRLFAIVLGLLADKDAPKILQQAQSVLSSGKYPGEVRAAAAEILAKRKGAEMMPIFVRIAKSKATTPVVLNWTMARLLREMDPAEVTEELMGRLAKARGSERIFLLDAMPVPCDKKVINKAKKGLKSKLNLERIATVRFLARAGATETIKVLQRGLSSEKDPAAMQAFVEGLGELNKHDDAWVERLVGWSQDGKPSIQAAASMEIMRMGRAEHLPQIVDWLKSPSWSIRQAALESLERMDSREVLEPIIQRMPEESGRLLFEFGEALFRMTGKGYGRKARVWQAWYDKEGESFDLLTSTELLEAKRKRSLKAQKQRTRTSRFFGMELRSARVIFVVDISGSMDETLKGTYEGEKGPVRMERAKEELISAIQGLHKGTRFNMIAFAKDVHPWLREPLADAEVPDREAAKTWVGFLSAGGGTNLYGSLVQAFEDPDVDTIMVLSDGEPSVGEIIDPGGIREAVQSMNANRNVRINTIALGQSLQILNWLAVDSGGEYVLIE